MVSVDNRPPNLLLSNLNLDHKLHISDDGTPSSSLLIAQLPADQQNSADKWTVAFSPDNSHFAWRCGPTTVAVIPWLSGISVGNEANANQQISKPMVVQCDDEVWSVAFGLTPHGRLPSIDDDANGRRRASLSKCPDFYNFRLPSNRLVLAVGLRNGRIRLYSVYAARFITELIDHKLPIRQLEFRPCLDNDEDDQEKESMILLSASRDSTLKLWNLLDDCNMFKTLEQHEKGEWVMCCSWAPNGRWAASGGTPSSLFVYDTNNWSLFKNLKGHLNVVTACQFSPDSALLASSSFDTTLILWNFQQGLPLRHFWHLLPAPRLIYASGANGYHVRSLSFSSDGEYLASVCDDGFLRTWSIFDPHPIPAPVALGAVSNAMCASFSPEGAFLCVGTREGNVRFFVSHMRVKNLTEICRLVLRRKICSSEDQIQNLPLSKQLKSFLLYEFT